MLFAFVLIMAASLWAIQGITGASAKETQAKAAPAFDGKLVLIYFKGRSSELVFTLMDVKLDELHGSKVLNGVHADTDDEFNWVRGRPVVISWDSVESMTLFESVDDYKKAIASSSDDTL
jgi:hypothetical protein